MQEYMGEPIDLKPFKNMFIICATLPNILLMLTFVLWFMFNSPDTVDPFVPPLTWTISFAALALATTGLAPLLRERLMRATGSFTSRYGQVLDGSAAAVGRVTAAAVVGMALPEVSVLLGFVLGFMSNSWLYYIPFAALTIIGWAYMYPRPSQVRTWYARQMGYSHVPGMPL